jgi:hypothetical protein
LRAGGPLRGLPRALIAGAVWLIAGTAAGQIYDSLDAYPPRWHLSESDCGARITSHANAPDGGVDGRGCERITLTAGHGTEAILVYPIEPVLPLDDLNVTLSVKSARSGARIGVRVRYPFVEDPATRRPIAVSVYGASYDRTGEYASIGIGMIERQVAMKTIALRREHGIEADLSEPYVDAVVVNAYSGPGTTSLRLDELRVEGLIPVGPDSRASSPSARDADTDAENSAARLRVSGDEAVSGRSRSRAFPLGRITRILQHNGEPLRWVRSLGFDAVLLAEPPDAEILREAIRSRLTIYAPPPSAPDPELEPLLSPVAGWYLGAGERLDRDRIDEIANRAEALRRWPSRWRRPLVGTPLESQRAYAMHLDAVIDDLPPRVRGIEAEEEIAEIRETRRRLRKRVDTAIGIASMPPESLIRQTNAIAGAIGAPPLTGFHWHAMWVQTMRSLETVPAAILLRSTRSLTSGEPLDSRRSMALSYVNRMVAMLEPWIASASPGTPPAVDGGLYRCGRLRLGETDVLIVTTTATRGSELLAGDGTSLEIDLAPDDANKTVWRLTHFSAERIMPETSDTGARIQIVSPDAVEVVVMSSDTAIGGTLSESARRLARQASLDRWQLTRESVNQTQRDWRLLDDLGIPRRRNSGDLTSVARRTLAEAEPLFRAGDTGATLRMARRADAWDLRSRWRMAEALMPDWPDPTSSPPVQCGAASIQAIWFPLMRDQGWGKNRLVTGSLDSPEFLRDGRWQFGRRSVGRAESKVLFAPRAAFSGEGALRARVVSLTDDGLPGGYEGTVVQIRSPGVRVAAGSAIRMDAMVRTLGFGDPHQGVLVYDTVAGQEAGVLVRGRAGWTPVRLYRHVPRDTRAHVMFELVGAGEVTIDEVQLRVWEPDAATPPPTRPIDRERPLRLGRGFEMRPIAGRVDNEKVEQR